MMSVFDSDPKFCPECGTIFPLPTGGDYILCMNNKCRYQVPVSAFDGIKTRSQLTFKSNTARKLADLPDEFGLGPMIDRVCPHCGNEKMVYTTLQTRSADEGQTVFYLCPKCRYRDREDS